MSDWWTEANSGPARSSALRYVARQPILDSVRATYGYELLFRESWENRFSGEGDTASHNVIDTALSFGLESIVDGAIPFINCTRSVIVERVPTLLPRNTVLELLETIEVDQELTAACLRLRAEGFRLALDDFDFHERWAPLLEHADFIKVDFRSSRPSERRELLTRLKRRPVRFIAEKVETTEEFQQALREGFHLFQGYFFTRPLVLGRPALAEITGKIRLLDQLRRPELDFTRIALVLREETSLAFRLLRLANSALMGRRDAVTSLEGALSVVGEYQFRRLAIAALTAELGAKQPREAQRLVLSTARFCELMSLGLQEHDSGLHYLFGMFSVLRRLLNLSLETITGTISLDSDMVDALSGKENVYTHLLQCSSSFGAGDWTDFRLNAERVGYSESEAWCHASNAQRWADQVLATAA